MERDGEKWRFTTRMFLGEGRQRGSFIVVTDEGAKTMAEECKNDSRGELERLALSDGDEPGLDE